MRKSNSYILLAVLFATLCIGSIYAMCDTTAQGPAFCYKHGIEIGYVKAIYKDNAGNWKVYDTWYYATKPIKETDGNWHFEDRAHSRSLSVIVPGEMFVTFQPDNQR